MTAVVADMHQGRRPRWLMPVLVGSLALNLIVIGAAGSLLWRGEFGASQELKRRVIPSVLGYSVTTLTPERLKALEEQTKEEWQEVRPARRALQAARAEWAQALSAVPFDRERLLAAQSRLVETDRKYRDVALKLYVAIGLNLTPEERRDFAGWRDRQRRGRPKHPIDRAQSASASGR